ncbi:MAG: amino acid adenylation domain-containing protein, partial [bacterium]|nr:amino acid adenylation domain-containing protein [bacterium]
MRNAISVKINQALYRKRQSEMRQLNKKNIEDIVGLTPLQDGILFHYLKNPGSDLYFEQLSIRITSTIENHLFEKAWNFVVKSNEILRTQFRWEKVKTPLQITLKSQKLQPLHYDLSARETNDRESLLEELKANDRKKQFHLETIPFRVTLCKLQTDIYEMIISNHHILYDGWSSGIILKEFFKSYNALSHNRLPEKTSKTPFKEYLKWIHSRDAGKQKKFWQEYLADSNTKGELAIKTPAPITTTAGKKQTEERNCTGTYRLDFEREIWEKQERFTGQHKVTTASLLYSAWGVLLQRYNNNSEALFGTTVSGRSAKVRKIESMVGLFINTLPLRVNRIPAETGLNLIKRIETHLQNREAFESTPPSEIRDYSPLGNDKELFDTIMVIENYPLDKELIEKNSALSIDNYAISNRTHYDLTVEITLFDEITATFVYNKNRLQEQNVTNLATHFKRLVKEIITNPHQEISTAQMVSPQEKHQLLFKFNDTHLDFPGNKTIHGLFTEQTVKTPHRISVVGKGKNTGNKNNDQLQYITYRELKKQAGHLAHRLREKGVAPGAIVALKLNRSIEMLIAVLGILEAGAAYLPIHPQYPAQRIRFILKDSNAALLLTTHSQSPEPEAIKKTLYIDEHKKSNAPDHAPRKSETPQRAESPSYIIYTSGSTGKPKGVVIEHRAAVNTLLSLQKKYPLFEKDTYLFKTAFIFDVSVTELFGWYLGGGRLTVLEKDGERDPAVILKTIEKQGITHINFIPAMFGEFVEALNTKNKTRLARLKYIFLAGEALQPGPVTKFRKLNTAIALENIYGPTETAIYATWYSLPQHDTSTPGKTLSIPIGTPLPNIKLYITDQATNLQPVGVPGELWISGSGVARGYLNRPELTAKCFTKTGWQCPPEAPCSGGIYYKTGDLARWLPDGNVEFLGRIDCQVKVRGYRIELGEIEAHLTKHQHIVEAVVVVKKLDVQNRTATGAEMYICAYVVPGEQTSFTDTATMNKKLKAYIGRLLPDYMVPTYFTALNEIPLTAGGKIDRKSLPAPLNIQDGSDEYTAPENELQDKLAGIWAEVLILDKTIIGIDDNFFQAGGHSLRASRLVTKIHKTLDVAVQVSDVFEMPTIRSLAAHIEVSGLNRFVTLKKEEKKKYYTLTSAQKRLYILQQMEAGSIAYNMSSVLILDKGIDVQILEYAYRVLIERHESLRTSFHRENNEPVQKVHDYKDITFAIDYYGNQNGGNEKKDPKVLLDEFVRPFDLTRAPLLRVGVLGEEEQKRTVIVDMHHIISDGISTQILVREYFALCLNKKLPHLEYQYKDYALWQKSTPHREIVKKQENYWLNEFAGQLPVLNLPLDYTRPEERCFDGARYHFFVNKEETKLLQKLNRENNTSLFMILLAAFKILLARLSGQEDIIVGTPTAGRRHADFENIIGMFVNTLPLRNYLRSENAFLSFLEKVKEKTLTAYENQDYQFEDIVEKVVRRRDQSRNPIFEVMFTLQNHDDFWDLREIAGNDNIPGPLGIMDSQTRVSRFDLTLSCVETKENLSFSFEYCSKLFKGETIERFAGYYQRILSSVINHPEQRLHEIDILPDQEKHRLLHEFNDTRSDYPADKTIHELFQHQAAKTPDKIALVSREQETGALTYAELNRRSGNLARQLQARNIKPGSIAAIKSERNAATIIGLLAILKAGGAYLPIDPGSPQERTRYMLADSNAGFLLSHRRFELDTHETCEIIFLDEVEEFNGDLRASSSPNNQSSFPNNQYPITNNSLSLSYIIYTSGTTGRPKGVMVDHRNVVRLVKNTDYITFKEEDRLLQTGALAFDASTFEIWGALLNGLTLYLTEDENILSPEMLKETITKHRITTMWMTSPLFNRQCQAEPAIFNGLKNLLIGGDVVSPAHVNRLKKVNPTVNIINGYGPTENTTFSTTHLIDKEYHETIPLGKPITNSTAYIVDKHGNPVPLGVTGELLVGGDGVARGYLNRPEQTAERFVQANWQYAVGSRQEEEQKAIKKRAKEPEKGLQSKLVRTAPLNKSFRESGIPVVPWGFSKRVLAPGGSVPPRVAGPPAAPVTDGIYYRTGDLAKWQPNGTIEFLGRIDDQVKIRGYRIELGEIENRLLQLETVKEAVVVAHEKQAADQYLCAYIVPQSTTSTPSTQSTTALKQALSQTLPEYMIPTYFIQLKAIPLTANGKVDKKALPEPGSKTGTDYTAPRNRLENQIHAIWKEVLFAKETSRDTRSIGIDDNFFDLGGHSLKAITLAHRLHKELTVKLSPTEIFDSPTIRTLAESIKKASKEEFLEIENTETKQYYSLSSAQKRLYLLQQMEPGNVHYNMPQVIPLRGMEISKERIEEIFNRLLERHESFRTSFHTIDEELVQVVCPSGGQGKSVAPCVPLGTPLALRAVDCNSFPNKQSFIRPFDMSEAPLLRIGLIKNEERADEYTLLIDMHHIISDGASMGILAEEFKRLYRGETLAELKLQYKDYAEWQRSATYRDRVKKQEKYWLEQLAGELPELILPMDNPRSEDHQFEGATTTFTISEEETAQLAALGRQYETTAYMTILALLNILLSRLSNQEDIIIGTPTAGRNHPGLETVIGMFVNTLPLRNYPAGEKTAAAILGEIKERTLAAFDNQDYQFEEMVEKIVTHRQPGRNPIFDIMFSLQTHKDNKYIQEFTETPAADEHPANQKGTAKFDLTLIAIEKTECYSFEIQYRTGIFKAETIDRIAGNFKTILTHVLREPEQQISSIDMLTQQEKQQILFEFNDTNADYPLEKTIHQLFEEQTQRTPDRISVVGSTQYAVGNIGAVPDVGGIHESPSGIRHPASGMQLTYHELNEKSNRLARLLQSKGAGPETIVAIMVERSIEMIIGLLGILKAGSAYLPIDPEAPGERMNYMLADSNARLFLVDDKSETRIAKSETKPKGLNPVDVGHNSNDRNQVSGAVVLNLEHFEYVSDIGYRASDLPIKASELAYVIYTSGSTGKPKGVLITHSNLSPLLHWGYKKLDLDSRAHTVQNLSYYFDWSVWEIFITLTSGAQLYMVTREILLNPEEYVVFMNKNIISVLHMTPTQYRYIIDSSQKPAHLKYLFLGAEKLTADLLERSFQS